MKKLIQIVCLIALIFSSLFSQEKITIAETDSPRFVLAGEKYSVASKITLKPSTKKIELYFHTDLNSALVSAEFRSPSMKKQLRFFRIDAQSDFDKVYKIESNEVDGFDETVGQITFTLVTKGSNQAQFLVTPNLNNYANENEIETAKIYKSSKAAGKSLVLEGNSSLSFKLNADKIENSDILIEFWANLTTDSVKFLQLTDVLNSELTSLSANSFGYLSIPSLLDAEYFNEVYIDKNVWNYYFIKFNRNNGFTKIYVNDDLYFTGEIEQLKQISSFNIVFTNTSADKKVKLDRFKVWSYGNHEVLALSNKNYSHYNCDSSEVIYLNNFNSRNAIASLDIEGKYKLEDSDAPIFSRAPLLNVSVNNQSFQLSWEISEFSNAEKFVIEKSYNGQDFQTVATVQKLNNEKNNFTSSDIDVTDNQIIFYRIKQVNEDNSEIYSSSVKVGRGKQIHFHVNQNYPNPFNPITTIALDVKRSAEFHVIVYDLVGNEIATLHDGFLNEGTHRFDFNGVDLPSGLYFCEVKSQNDLEVMKMILAK